VVGLKSLINGGFTTCMAMFSNGVSIGSAIYMMEQRTQRVRLAEPHGDPWRAYYKPASECASSVYAEVPNSAYESFGFRLVMTLP
jgi:hypothetical protein